MRGVRRRLKGEHEGRIAQSWQTGAFSGLAQSKAGLRPLDHYLRRPARPMSAEQMLSAMQALTARANSKYEVN